MNELQKTDFAYYCPITGWAIVGGESFRSRSVQLSQSQDGFSRETYYLVSKDYGRDSWSVKQYTRRANDQNAFTDIQPVATHISGFDALYLCGQFESARIETGFTILPMPENQGQDQDLIPYYREIARQSNIPVSLSGLPALAVNGEIVDSYGQQFSDEALALARKTRNITPPTAKPEAFSATPLLEIPDSIGDLSAEEILVKKKQAYQQELEQQTLEVEKKQLVQLQAERQKAQKQQLAEQSAKELDKNYLRDILENAREICIGFENYRKQSYKDIFFLANREKPSLKWLKKKSSSLKLLAQQTLSTDEEILQKAVIHLSDRVVAVAHFAKADFLLKQNKNIQSTHISKEEKQALQLIEKASEFLPQKLSPQDIQALKVDYAKNQGPDEDTLLDKLKESKDAFLKHYFNACGVKAPDSDKAMQMFLSLDLGTIDNRKELAAYPFLQWTPQEITQQLAKDEDWEVRDILAKNAALAQLPDAALQLAQDKDKYVRYALIRNTALARFPETIQQLAKDEDENARKALAENTALAQFPDIAIQLAQDEDEDVRRALVKNTALAQLPDAALQLAKDESWCVRDSLAENGALEHFPDIAQQLAKDKYENVRLALAVNAALAQLPDAALQLAKDESYYVRDALAENTALAQLPDAALQLAKDKNWRVRDALAENTALAQLPDVALQLAKDKYWIVRAALAKNPALAQLPDAALQLAKDQDNDVRKILVQNTALAQLPDAALQLAKDKDNDVRRALARSDALAQLPDAALQLAKDKDNDVRRALAWNAALAQLPDTALQLAQDESWYVCRALVQNTAVQEALKSMRSAPPAPQTLTNG